MGSIKWCGSLLLEFCCIQFVFPRCDDFRTVPKETVVIPEGGGTTLYCEYATPARVDWYYMETTLIAGSDIRERCDCTSVSSGAFGRNLTFLNFRIGNSAGRYGCWATIANGFDECNFNVVGAVAPVIMLNQNDVQLNDDLTVSPTINFGLPEATVTWSRNGQILDPGDPRVAISGEGVLTVTGVQASDRGVYTVTASNSAVPDGVRDSVNVNIDFLQLEGPTYMVIGNREIQAICTAMGFPSFTIDWTTSIAGHEQMSSSSNAFENSVSSTWNTTVLPACNSYLYLSCEAAAGRTFVRTGGNFSLPCDYTTTTSAAMVTVTMSPSAMLHNISITITVVGAVLALCALCTVVVAAAAYHKKVTTLRNRSSTLVALEVTGEHSNSETPNVLIAENGAYGVTTGFSLPDVMTKNRVYGVNESQGLGSDVMSKNSAYGMAESQVGPPDVISKNSAYGITQLASPLDVKIKCESQESPGVFARKIAATYDSEVSEVDPYEQVTAV